jgi:phosphatidylglycerol:prolipoprotein diacylglycerol transferase
MIAIGAAVTIAMAQHDKTLNKLTPPGFLDRFILYTVGVMLLGGRSLSYILKPIPFSFFEFISVWKGGLSILGAMVAVLIFAPLYLYKNKIKFFPFADRVSIYLPFLQMMGRFGCFFAGCCHGTITTVPWAITYTDQHSMAILNVPVHPTQLYSAFLFLCLFIALYRLKDSFKRPGQLLSLYLIGASLERFLVDFLREDRTLIVGALSMMQCIALGLIGTGFIILMIVQNAKSNVGHKSL